MQITWRALSHLTGKRCAQVGPTPLERQQDAFERLQYDARPSSFDSSPVARADAGVFSGFVLG